jgi:hypothetical protein
MVRCFKTQRNSYQLASVAALLRNNGTSPIGHVPGNQPDPSCHRQADQGKHDADFGHPIPLPRSEQFELIRWGIQFFHVSIFPTNRQQGLGSVCRLIPIRVDCTIFPESGVDPVKCVADAPRDQRSDDRLYGSKQSDGERCRKDATLRVLHA